LKNLFLSIKLVGKSPRRRRMENEDRVQGQVADPADDPKDWDHERERYIIPLGNGGRKFSKCPTCQ